METIKKTIKEQIPFVDLVGQCGELAPEVMPAIEKRNSTRSFHPGGRSA